ncbi:MAG: hypothetical protein ACREUT_21720 [Steroidobacteraceae bacterium]
MKSLTTLASIARRPILPMRPSTPVVVDERVLLLFKNRAELKKAYDGLQDEVYRLKDRVKQQEGATARVQEMLAALESRLGLVATAYPALVFYQLRALWQHGREILGEFVADLAAAQEERERRAFLAECNRRLFAQRRSIETRLRAAETQHAAAHGHTAELGAARAQLTRLWHFFKRRELDRRLQAARSAAAAADLALADARGAAEQLDAEPAAEFRGLSVEARRAINLAAIAYAEVLCLRLADTPLVALAREATARREVADSYGERPECERLIAAIARARSTLASKVTIAPDVKSRSERLKSIARYRNGTDTTPSPESVAIVETDLLAGEPLGQKRAARMPNVLAEDSWDLFRVLLR